MGPRFIHNPLLQELTVILTSRLALVFFKFTYVAKKAVYWVLILFFMVPV